MREGDGNLQRERERWERGRAEGELIPFRACFLNEHVPRFERFGQFVDIGCHENPEVVWRRERVTHTAKVRGHSVGSGGIFQLLQLFLQKLEL